MLMPDHIHFILILEEAKISLCRYIQDFKSKSTLEVKKAGFVGKRLWQPNYYEHVIGDEIALKKNEVPKNPAFSVTHINYHRDINSITSISQFVKSLPFENSKGRDKLLGFSVTGPNPNRAPAGIRTQDIPLRHGGALSAELPRRKNIIAKNQCSCRAQKRKGRERILPRRLGSMWFW